jgi:threonyl-tRNA synthetase
MESKEGPMGMIGDAEIAENVISVRVRSGEDLGKIETSKFLTQLKENIDKKV